jgi:2-haloacid dehalogenase
MGQGGERLVACHAWDTPGAAAAGRDTALILGRGPGATSGGRQPTLTASDLVVVAEALIARPVH